MIAAPAPRGLVENGHDAGWTARAARLSLSGVTNERPEDPLDGTQATPDTKAGGPDVCPECGGTGAVGPEVCPSCEGTGRVEEE